jgi:hypothetical protein
MLENMCRRLGYSAGNPSGRRGHQAAAPRFYARGKDIGKHRLLAATGMKKPGLGAIR